MCLKLKRMLYERTLTSMINPEVVTKGSGSWQLTGKIDDLDYADLVNLKANVEFANKVEAGIASKPNLEVD